jgi:hypothetical protein
MEYSQIFSNVPALIKQAVWETELALPDTGRMWAAADSAQ